MTTWLELSKLPEGTRLRFTADWDIFPECLVSAGTVCTLHENSFNEACCMALLAPDDESIRDALRHYDGLVYIPGPRQHWSMPDWNDESPLEVIQ